MDLLDATDSRSGHLWGWIHWVRVRKSRRLIATIIIILLLAIVPTLYLESYNAANTIELAIAIPVTRCVTNTPSPSVNFTFKVELFTPAAFFTKISRPTFAFSADNFFLGKVAFSSDVDVAQSSRPTGHGSILFFSSQNETIVNGVKQTSSDTLYVTVSGLVITPLYQAEVTKSGSSTGPLGYVGYGCRYVIP